MIDWSKLYDEFLYDCYIANQRLTEEDWLYYGREEHHIEIPNRDGGLLTPLNSQYLTTYQHWIAGVLQSEVLGKQCFAFVPKDTLPCTLEALRIKHYQNLAKLMNAAQTPESRRIAALKGAESLTQEFIEKRAQVGGVAVTKQRWQCTTTGKVSCAAPLTRWQTARGIDPSNRVRRYDLEETDG